MTSYLLYKLPKIINEKLTNAYSKVTLSTQTRTNYDIRLQKMGCRPLYEILNVPLATNRTSRDRWPCTRRPVLPFNGSDALLGVTQPLVLPWRKLTNRVPRRAPRRAVWCAASSWGRRSGSWPRGRTSSWCPPRSACRCRGRAGRASAASPACRGASCTSSSSTAPPTNAQPRTQRTAVLRW